MAIQHLLCLPSFFPFLISLERVALDCYAMTALETLHDLLKTRNEKEIEAIKKILFIVKKQTPGDHESWRLINFMKPKNVSEYYKQ